MATFNNCKTIADFTDAENDLATAMEEHLRRSGWTHTSDTPGHVWMWQRTLDGRDVLVDFATAWRIQGHIEEPSDGE